MITEQRLRELIEQKATIYEVKYNQINIIDLKDKEVKNFTEKYVHFAPYRDEKFQFHKYYDRLFETKEEAEWHLEFGNITRTETLKLPTWEEFCKAPNLKFCGAEHNLYHLFSDLKWLWFEQVVDENWTIGLYLERATKGNYIEACRLAKKLFLEGDDEIK